MKSIEEVINVTKRIANYSTAESQFKDLTAKEDIRLAALLIIFGGVYSALMSTLVGVFTIYTERFQYMAAGVDVPEITLNLDLIMPFLSHNLVYVMPIGIISMLISQAFVFAALRITRGKGTLSSQIYQYSFLFLILSLSSTIMILSLFTCIGWLVVMPFILFMVIYVQLYLQSLMLMNVHGVSMAHVILVIIIMTIVGIGLPALIGMAMLDAGITPPTIETVMDIESPGGVDMDAL